MSKIKFLKNKNAAMIFKMSIQKAKRMHQLPDWYQAYDTYLWATNYGYNTLITIFTSQGFEPGTAGTGHFYGEMKKFKT